MLVLRGQVVALTTWGVYLLTYAHKRIAAVSQVRETDRARYGTHRFDGRAELESADAAAREERREIEVIIRRHDGHVCTPTMSTKAPRSGERAQLGRTPALLVYTAEELVPAPARAKDNEVLLSPRDGHAKVASPAGTAGTDDGERGCAGHASRGGGVRAEHRGSGELANERAQVTRQTGLARGREGGLDRLAQGEDICPDSGLGDLAGGRASSVSGGELQPEEVGTGDWSLAHHSCDGTGDVIGHSRMTRLSSIPRGLSSSSACGARVFFASGAVGRRAESWLRSSAGWRRARTL